MIQMTNLWKKKRVFEKVLLLDCKVLQVYDLEEDIMN